MKTFIKDLYFAFGAPAFFIHEGLHYMFAQLLGANITNVKFGVWCEYKKVFHYYYLTFKVGFDEKNIWNYLKVLIIALSPLFAYVAIFFEPYLAIYFLLYHKILFLSPVDRHTIKKSYENIMRHSGLQPKHKSSINV